MIGIVPALQASQIIGLYDLCSPCSARPSPYSPTFSGIILFNPYQSFVTAAVLQGTRVSSGDASGSGSGSGGGGNGNGNRNGTGSGTGTGRERERERERETETDSVRRTCRTRTDNV